MCVVVIVGVVWLMRFGLLFVFYVFVCCVVACVCLSHVFVQCCFMPFGCFRFVLLLSASFFLLVLCVVCCLFACDVFLLVLGLFVYLVLSFCWFGDCVGGVFF